jgi:hypothetical protein
MQLHRPTIIDTLQDLDRKLAATERQRLGVLVLLDADGRIVAHSDKTSGQVEPRFLQQVRSTVARH